MAVSQRGRRPHGRAIRCVGGYDAFVPAPLPPPIAWDVRLAAALSRADLATGRLAVEGRRLPNPHLFIRSFVRREAVLSSRIEGTRTTLGPLLAAEASAAGGPDPADLLEVGNHVAALEYGLDRLEDAGIVSLFGNAKRNRVYCARAVLTALEGSVEGTR